MILLGNGVRCEGNQKRKGGGLALLGVGGFSKGWDSRKMALCKGKKRSGRGVLGGVADDVKKRVKNSNEFVAEKVR